MSEDLKPVHVTAADVMNVIAELAYKKPGVYERAVGGCVNTDVDADGNVVPSCIVGSYFSEKIGVDKVPSSGTAEVTADTLVTQGLITITPEARYLLTVAQTLQDTREVPWRVVSDVLHEIRSAANSFVQRTK